MREVIKHETLGEIVYEEGFWGKKMLYINGAEMEKISKNVFKMENGEQVTLKGNFLMGVSMQVGGETIQLTPKVKWYEIAMSILPLIIGLVWGNVPALVNIVPLVGGALGGLFGGLFFALSVCCVKKVKPIWLKLIIALGMAAATFGVCCGLAYAILASI